MSWRAIRVGASSISYVLVVGAVGLQRQRTWFRSPSVGLMALAATLLLVAGVRLYVAAQDAESGPRLRGGSAVSTYPVRWLPSVGAGLAWRPTDGADSYRLEVVDEQGLPSSIRSLRDTSFVRRGFPRARSPRHLVVGDGHTRRRLDGHLPPNSPRFLRRDSRIASRRRVQKKVAVSRRLRAAERNVDWRSFILHTADAVWARWYFHHSSGSVRVGMLEVRRLRVPRLLRRCWRHAAVAMMEARSRRRRSTSRSRHAALTIVQGTNRTTTVTLTRSRRLHR